MFKKKLKDLLLLPTALPSSITSIGVLRLSAFGDIIWTVPLIIRLKELFPHATLYYFIAEEFLELGKKLPFVSLIPVKKPRHLQAFLDLKKTASSWPKLDILLMTQTSLRSGLISLFIKAKIKIGYPFFLSEDFHYFFCHQHLPIQTRPHFVDLFFEFSLFLEKKFYLTSVSITKPLPQFSYINIPNKEALFLKFPFLKEKTFAILHPFSSKENKNFSYESYAKLIIKFFEKDTTSYLILTGSKNDIPKIEELLRILKLLYIEDKETLTKVKEQLLNLSGQTSIDDLFALVSHSFLVMGPDTGIIHLADSLQIAVKALFTLQRSALYARPYSQPQHVMFEKDV